MAGQIVHSSRRGARDIEHCGSAHDEAELEALKAAAAAAIRGGPSTRVGPRGCIRSVADRVLAGWGICGTRCAGPTTQESARRLVVERESWQRRPAGETTDSGVRRCPVQCQM
jgi:hypothetical protein